MTWKPKSGAAYKPPPPRPGGDAGKSRKRRHRRPAQTLDYDDEAAVIMAGQKASLRQAKAKRAQVMQTLNAKHASQAQINYLSDIFECPRLAVLVRFVEFANGLSSNTGSMQPFEKGKTFLSRIYWIRAIDMAKTGQNVECNADDEVARSFGYDDYFDMLSNQFRLDV